MTVAVAVSISGEDLFDEDDEVELADDPFDPRAREARWPRTFPHGWHACRGCGLAVPRRETYCTLCLFEIQVLEPERGVRWVVCQRPMIGRRPTARYCSNACQCRAGYRRRKAAAASAQYSRGIGISATGEAAGVAARG